MNSSGYNLRQRPLPVTVSNQSSLSILSAITTAIGSSSGTLVSPSVMANAVRGTPAGPAQIETPTAAHTASGTGRTSAPTHVFSIHLLEVC